MILKEIVIDDEYSLEVESSNGDAGALMRKHNGTGFYIDILFGKGKNYNDRKRRPEVEALEGAKPIIEASRKETFDEMVKRIRASKPLIVEKIKEEVKVEEAQLSGKF